MKPSKPFSVSHTKLATFRRCLQQYHWKYVDKYFPPSGIGQLRGSAGHEALANWHVDYNAEKATQAAWDYWSRHGQQHDEEWQILEDSLARYYVWSKANDAFKLIKSEQEFKIDYEIPGAAPFTFTGFIDGIVEEKKSYWLLENKFYRRMENNVSEMDVQVSLYLLASRLLKYDVQGVIYNMVRVANTKVTVTEPVVRKRLHRNAAGFERIQGEMLLQVQAMANYHEKGGMPYRNPTKDCSWDCPFYHPCLSMTDDGQVPTQMLQQITQQRSVQDNGW